MSSKSTAEIRQTFLDFFHTKGHKTIPSSSLVPDNDPTLLFTNAGMNQFKDIFLGLDKQPYSRVTTIQRCVRAGGKHNDLEKVGYTASHHTFFEMLGNFSFGDYFKEDAIKYAWELLTSKQWFNLLKERFWVTVYHTDDESYKIWQREIGIPTEHIIRIGDNKGALYSSDNFWQMGDTGPCGPCTEIFYDHGEHILGGPPGSSEVGDRYIEIWNIVFIQFNRQFDGSLKEILSPSIDTGMGLERIATILQHVNSNYEIDLFHQLITFIAREISLSDFNNKSLRVIADHIRSSVFLIGDGVFPTNEGRGYVLRRIIRRAVRHGYMLGMRETFFYKLVAPLIQVMGNVADNLKSQQVRIERILKNEEEKFACTLVRGLQLLDNELIKLQGDTLAGKIAFRLYDTYGFPLDLTTDICRERNVKIDKSSFDIAMEQQRYQAKKSSVFVTNYNNIKVDNPSYFFGYQKSNQQATVIAIFYYGKSVNILNQGEEGVIFLDKTVFYAESGGQVGDSGILASNYAQFTVFDTQKYNQAIGHIGKVLIGSITVSSLVEAKINIERRNAISLNHSATHLLHAALRVVLGEHVTQKGSLVNEKYLRFDFSHFTEITPRQILQIENMINYQIRKNNPIITTLMDLEAAKKHGAIAFFYEKYNTHEVRVLSIGDFSIELCGGTHANRTGDIGLFYINNEVGIAAGVRRIEAITGQVAIDKVHSQAQLLINISQLMQEGNNSNLIKKIKGILNKMKLLELSLNQLKQKEAIQESVFLSERAKKVNGINLVVTQLNNFEPKYLRLIVDDLKKKLKTAIVVLSTISKNKVNLIVGVTDDLTTKIKASDLILFIVQQLGGKGGGRSDIAQGGGSNVTELPAALASVEDWVNLRLISEINS